MAATRMTPLLTVLAATACSPFVTTQLDPNGALPLVRGYRGLEDSCSLTGESDFTRPYLDDAADLVTCPIGSAAEESLLAERNPTRVAQTVAYNLYSVPRR